MGSPVAPKIESAAEEVEEDSVLSLELVARYTHSNIAKVLTLSLSCSQYGHVVLSMGMLDGRRSRLAMPRLSDEMCRP